MAADLNLLKPKVKAMAKELLGAAAAQGITMMITQTLRTFAEQDALYAQGRTKPGPIVTNAKGGYSLHNYGVAFDFCPTIGGKLQWSNIALFDKIGAIGESVGLEWGGRWEKFVDKPHFQLDFGYSIEEFRRGQVDWGKYEIVLFPTLSVLPKAGLNIRAAASTTAPIIGKLYFGQKVTPIGKEGVWYKIPFVGGSAWVAAQYLG